MALLGHRRGTDRRRSRAISARSAPRSSFASFAASRRISLDPKQEADIHLLRYAEHLLASAIGAASSRLVLSLLLRKRTVSTKAALKLLDDANAAIQYNREILQTALDHVRQGIAVFDKDLQLVCWNRQFGEILDLPPALTRVGIGLDEILRHNAERARSGRAGSTTSCASASRAIVSGAEPIRERFAERGLVVEIRANHMPDGGLVTTATDITPSVEAAEALERANENLERRVKERTEELTRLNAALGARQGRGRGSQHLQDALSRRREPRHPAAAQCRAALRHQPGRAPGQRRGRAPRLATSMPRSRRWRKSSARCSTSRGSIPARCGRRSPASASTS